MKKHEQECYQDWCEGTLSNIDDPKSNIRLILACEFREYLLYIFQNLLAFKQMEN
jgi:hypothetical protein